MLLEQLLSKEDAIYLLELIHGSLSCVKEEDMGTLILDLKRLIPYEYAICGLAKKDGDGKIKFHELINISYPDEWIDLYIRRKYHQVDPIFKEGLTCFRLQDLADVYKINSPPKEFLSITEDFGLKGGYISGFGNHRMTEGSLISISGESVEHHSRTKIILELVVPHLHQAITRILDQHNNNNKQTAILSPREKEVLNWLKKGKSSWDISVILGISERTVNFHINNIMQKLDAMNRTHSVAVAIEQGLIDSG